MITVNTETSYKSIFSAFRLLFSATFVCMILGIATNKIIALSAGPDGIAVIGLYRNLINSVVTILSIGMTTLIVQKISSASSDEIVKKLIRSISSILILQITLIVIISTLLADLIAEFMFSAKLASEHVNDIKIVLCMAVVILISQTMTSILNAKVSIKYITVINVATSSATLVLAYPLIKLGHSGLAMVVGAGSLIGGVIATYYVIKSFNLTCKNIKPIYNLRDVFSSLSISGYLIVHPIITTGTIIVIQSMISKNYDLRSLGYYNAVVTIESVSLGIIMSSLRTYFLPMLGKIDSQIGKEIFINKIITMLLISLLPLTVGMILGSKFVLLILYSSKFIPASPLVSLQSMAMLIHAYTWCYAFYLNHKARYETFVLLDSVMAVITIGGTWFVSTHNYPLAAVVLVYLFSCITMFFLYIFVVFRLYGRGMLHAKNIKLGLITLLVMLLAFIVSFWQSATLFHIIFFLIICIYTFCQFKKHCLQKFAEEIP